VIFAGNQYAALLHDVGGKTAHVSRSQYGIQPCIFQHLRTGFFITLRSRGLPGQQSQLAVCLTPWNTKETELLNAVQGCPGTDVLNAVA